MTDPKGNLVTPVALDPDLTLDTLHVDSDGNLLISGEISGTVNVNEPVSVDGTVHAIIDSIPGVSVSGTVSVGNIPHVVVDTIPAVVVSGSVGITGTPNVAVTSTVEQEVDNNVWDGSNWQKQLGDTNGVPYNTPLPDQIYDKSGISQILRDNSVTNGSVDVYQVGSGKTFFLTSLYLDIESTTVGGAAGSMSITDSSNVKILAWVGKALVTTIFTITLHFNPPIKLAATNKVRVGSADATTLVHGAITGYER